MVLYEYPFNEGIRTMLVEPGFFRTELLTKDSTTYAQPTIDDYAERTKEIGVRRALGARVLAEGHGVRCHHPVDAPAGAGA